jgi:TetR/AcrR family transcriptional regulator
MSTKVSSSKDGFERILHAARNEFCTAGLAGAKLELIATEAGVSKRLIHHYFRTKADLYVAVLDDISSLVVEELIALDYESCTPPDAVKLFLEHIFDLFVRWPFLAGLYTDESLYGGEHLDACRRLNTRAPELVQRLNTILAAGQSKGDFKPDSAPETLLGGALMVVIGCFTSGNIMVSLLNLNLSTPEDFEFWKGFSIDFVMAALRP